VTEQQARLQAPFQLLQRAQGQEWIQGLIQLREGVQDRGLVPVPVAAGRLPVAVAVAW
jgi:hypothetical protein